MGVPWGDQPKHSGGMDPDRVGRPAQSLPLARSKAELWRTVVSTLAAIGSLGSLAILIAVHLL